jgi:hypothetical protein
MVHAENFHAAAIERNQIQQAFEQRGFAGAVQPRERETFALGDTQGKPIQRNGGSVAFGYVSELNGSAGHRRKLMPNLNARQ